jgi:hypothetical protein
MWHHGLCCSASMYGLRRPHDMHGCCVQITRPWSLASSCAPMLKPGPVILVCFQGMHTKSVCMPLLIFIDEYVMTEGCKLSNIIYVCMYMVLFHLL